MGTTRSTVMDRSRQSRAARSWLGARSLTDTLALWVATAVSVMALFLTYEAKSLAISNEAGAPAAMNLSAPTDVAALEARLTELTRDPRDRRFTAAAILRALPSEGRAEALENVGVLARIRVTAAEVRGSGATRLVTRLGANTADDATVPLLTAAELAQVKHLFVVRDAAAFRSSVWWSALLYLAAVHGVAIYWRWRRLNAERWLLPTAHLLTGLGLAAMLSLQDPLRDRLLIADFALGVAIGCVAMAAFSSFAYQTSNLRRLSLLPLLVAVALSVLLIAFGSGPGSSDAKVNLLGMQPVEVIRVLLVLFLAGYFASRWEFVRQLREEQFGGLELPKRFRVPRYDHVLPVIVGVALALGLFFLQKDLGPALVFGCLFLTLYGVARKRVALVGVGVLLMVSGFAAGHWLGYPGTVGTRVAMWLSPWDNAARGGDHVAQSLWAYASGGASGTGLALGAPHLIAEAHTDMVLATLGEELGFLGIVGIALLYAVLCYRGLSIAMRAGGDYGFFLALGLTLSLVLPVLLIAGGTLGAFPLSGVATPFLSYGKSSMIVNFAVLGMLCAIARENETKTPATAPFARPVRVVGGVLTLLSVVILTRAAVVQVFAADETMAHSSLAAQGDGMLRYQDNPRLRRASLLIPRGSVVDRRGVPLAVTRCADLEKHTHALRELGVVDACDDSAQRNYPLAGATYHLLGDRRTRINWGASNTSLEERDHESRLRGFDDHERVVETSDPRTGRTVRIVKRDYSELVPLWRYRHRPGHPAVRRLMERPRDLRLTIDARLQTRLSDALDRQLARTRRSRGAIVVMDVSSGDVLAIVNAPRPGSGDPAAFDRESATEDDAGAWFDRARYGLYPPGSTFKLVTAAAALRKDAAFSDETFICRRLPDGRNGNKVAGWSRPIRDDELDTVPHGAVNLQKGIEQSCNAYFAQLAMRVGASALHETGELFEIALAQPDTAGRLRNSLPHAGYGQGEVRVTPFKMARVVAAIANGGRMPYGRWVSTGGDRRDRAPAVVMTPAMAAQIGSYMRGVVQRGTARPLASVSPPIAGKTGTAEVDGAASHAWFAGFAPYGATAGRRIAFAILIENGGYGGRSAAPLAGEIVRAAREFGLLHEDPR